MDIHTLTLILTCTNSFKLIRHMLPAKTHFAYSLHVLPQIQEQHRHHIARVSICQLLYDVHVIINWF